jgi:RNA polymerase sigma factor (sigma-70 family)
MSSDVLQASIQRDFAAARAGDKDAYGRLIVATQGMVTGIALAHTHDPQLSQDIAQETYLRGWMRLGDMSQAESFLPWLRQVARKQAIDQFRKRRHRETSVSPDDFRLTTHADVSAGPEQAALDTELTDWLRYAIDEVPEDTREVLMLFYMEGQSSQQVAALLGMSDANVRKRLQRARSSLNDKFLRRFAAAARDAAPGSGLAAAVLAALGGAGSSVAKAAAASGTAKVGSALLTGATGVIVGLAAVIGAVFVGVYLETRSLLRQVRSSGGRRAMIVNSVVYASLMVGFILGLRWVKSLGWSGGETMTLAVVVSLLVLALAVHRTWLIRREHAGD